MLAFIPMGAWLLTAALTMRDAAVAIEARTKEFMEVKLPEFEERLRRFEGIADDLALEIEATNKNVTALVDDVRAARAQLMDHWALRFFFGEGREQSEPTSGGRKK